MTTTTTLATEIDAIEAMIARLKAETRRQDFGKADIQAKLQRLSFTIRRRAELDRLARS